jgi:tetratricopeptide (TPR) repeat protein
MKNSAETHPAPLLSRRLAFVGKLGSMTRREAQRLVRSQGGTVAERPGPGVDLVVIGADELPLSDQDDLLDDETRRAAAEGRLEIIGETQFWQRLGLVEQDLDIRRLHTPAMLAELLKVPVATIRRWHRRGLIVPAKEVHRLPYFDFQEVATARRLTELVAAGVSASAIEKKLAELARLVPDVERPLAQLSVLVQGKQLLVREGEGLIEPLGQRRIDFEALDGERVSDSDGEQSPGRIALRLAPHADPAVCPKSPEELLALAAELADDDQLAPAVDLYRAALAARGPRAEVCFELAELLYRLGDLPGARERYYMAIELDEDYVEARANLGCVLAELGDLPLAVAAFEGALAHHAEYPDAHYHLARTLDELRRPAEAEAHWREFLTLAPGSPFADEARERLEEMSP